MYMQNLKERVEAALERGEISIQDAREILKLAGQWCSFEH
jgi:hypothetical protein